MSNLIRFLLEKRQHIRSQPPSYLLHPVAPYVIRHHTSFIPRQSNAIAASMAVIAVGGKRRGEAVMMPVDRPQHNIVQQQQQPTTNWRPQSYAQQQPLDDCGPHACSQQPQLARATP